MRDEEDDLPFASRPKKVAAKAKPTKVTAGVTTSYNEILDDDTYEEADDPVPQTRLAGIVMSAGASLQVSSLLRLTEKSACVV